MIHVTFIYENNAIKVGQPVARLPITNPGVRNYRIGLFNVVRFARGFTQFRKHDKSAVWQC